MRRTLLAAACALAASAPTGAQRPNAPDRRTQSIVGCYELVTGRWSAGADTMAIASHAPPRRFRLDSLQRTGFPPGFHQVQPPSGTSLLNIDSWRWTDSTRLVITWSANTIAGVRLDLRTSGDSLAGNAASFDESVAYDRPYATAPVVARRVACTRIP